MEEEWLATKMARPQLQCGPGCGGAGAGGRAVQAGMCPAAVRVHRSACWVGGHFAAARSGEEVISVQEGLTRSTFPFQ